MFYFTFGNSGRQVFNGGWVRINADTLDKAVAKFKARYGPRAMVDSVVNCAFMYSESEFKQTCMYRENDNLGHAEYEYIE